MNQSRLESFVESSINISSGFILSLIVWVYIIMPVWNIQVTMLDNLTITGVFTVISITRSYFWRRFFNARIHLVIHSLIKRGFKK